MTELRLGEATVRPDTGEVRSRNGVSHLEPKSMAVLLYLIERHKEVISREELLDAVWPGIHVGDDSLTAAIIKIRRALGDDARDPSHIETIPKRGYRLISPLCDSDSDDPSTYAVVTKPKVAVSGKWLLPALAILVAILGIAISATLSSKGAPELQDSPVDALAVIEVTPFSNVSGDSDQEYLAVGISDTILNDLANNSGLSVRQNLESASPLKQADYILQGSVARTEDNIRIVARLLDGEDGNVLKALQFDEKFDDLLAIEDEIRKNVLTEIAGTIDARVRSRRARGYTENLAAYDLFLQAQSQLLVRTASTNSVARDLYRDAIAADETFARAYGGLALSYAAEYRNGWVEDGNQALENAMKFAQTAVGISPNLPEQHWVIGYVLTQQRDFVEAESHLKRAIDISPGFADAYALLGGIETYRGNPASTIPLLHDALRKNANAGYLYFLLLARAYYFLGDYEQAHINLSEALGRNPENVEAHLYLAATLLHLNRIDEAEWEAMEVLGIEPEFSLQSWSANYPMARGAQLEKLLADLRLAGLS